MDFRDNEGYWIPFPEPIPVPEGDVTTSLDRMLLFPEFYQPYILGALKVLTRPEIYDGTTKSEFAFAMQQGEDILAAVSVFPHETTDVYYSLSASGFYGSTTDVFYDKTTGAMSSDSSVASDGLSSSNISITMHSHPDGDNIGAFLSVEIFYSPVASKAYVITGHTCTGLISESGFVTDGHALFTWEDAKDVSISIDAITVSLWKVVAGVEIVCAPV